MKFVDPNLLNIPGWRHMNSSSSKVRVRVFWSGAKLFTGFLLSFLVLSTLANAQSLGTITGTVTDQSGASLAGANVTMHNEATGEDRATVSNGTGYFSFAAVTPGAYTVKVQTRNFKAWEHKGIPLLPGDVRTVEAALQVGANTETVEVVSTADEIALVDSGERSAVITAQQIQNLTLQGRDVTELVRTLPGFAVFGGGSIQNSAGNNSIVSPTSGTVGQNYVGNGSPYRSGGSDLTMDGAHIIDTGCNCGATATVNGDMVSEVKVQTSNFGADSAKGPIVVNVIGKSGTTSYHGEAYLHARDNSLNSLDWAFKNQMLINNATNPLKISPPTGRFLYPGVQFSGPVPHTNKKLVFDSAYEYYYQAGFAASSGGSINGLITDTVPTASMRNGIFDINPAVAPDNTAFCTSGGNTTAPVCTQAFNTSPTFNSPVGGVAPYPKLPGPNSSNFGWTDSTATLGGSATFQNIPTASFDPGGAIYLANIPSPNADPSATGGFDYIQPVNQSQNGWMWRSRADYNYSENSKLYVTYQIQKETDEVPIHLWWQPGNSIPFPGGLAARDNSQTVSGHYVKIINPTLTNDLQSALGYVNYPLTSTKKNAWSKATGGIAGTAYPYPNEPYANKSTMMPQLGNGYWLAGVPQMEQPDIFSGSGGAFLWKKWNYTAEDNLTKAYKTHTIKGGFYFEKSENDTAEFTDYNGNFEVAAANWNNTPMTNCFDNAHLCGSNNPVANLLLGTGNFDEVNKQALDRLWEPNYSGFVQDDWKLTKRLTLNLGLRADHLGAWRTADGSGMPTWTGNLNVATAAVPGFTWHGETPSVPVTGRDVSSIIWQPRLGMALDVLGNGKTVLRGGWGEYGYRDTSTSVGLSQGVVQYNNTYPISISFAQGFGIPGSLPSVGCGPQRPGGGTCGNTAGTLLRDHNQPISRNYNLTISQQLPGNSLLEAGYVGSESLYGMLQGSPQNLNVIPIGAVFAATGCSPLQQNNPGGAAGNGCTIPVPPNLYPYNTDFGSAQVNVGSHLAKTNYNALQLSWVRSKGRVTYNLNYTWSKALGTQGTSQLNGSAPDPTNLHHDYGVLSIDRSHIINLSYVLQEGNPLHGAIGYALNGWNLSGVTTWQSGPDLTTLSSTNLSLNGSGPSWFDPTANSWGAYGLSNTAYLGSPSPNLQPTVICNPTAHLKAHEYFAAACFSGPTPGVNGPWQLPYMHGPAFFNSDLSVFKTFKIAEKQNAEFRLSAFNFLNHALDSFQNNGDIALSMAYECNGAPASGSNHCPLGSGTYVVQNLASGNYKLTGTNIATGYASTKLGNRVLEMSAKYTF